MPASQTFTQAADKKDGYRFDFQREVAAFYAAQPAAIDTLFYEVHADGFALIDGGRADALPLRARFAASAAKVTTGSLRDGTARIDRDLGDLLHNVKLLRDCRAAGVALDRQNDFAHVIIAGADLLRSNVGGRRFQMPGFDGTQDAALFAQMRAFTLDHEIGHVKCARGSDGGNMGESIADAYATIRQIQRFGADAAGLLSVQVLKRQAALFLLPEDKAIHYTAPVMQKIIADSAQVDFSKLDAAETLRLASEYGQRHAAYAAHLVYACSANAALPAEDRIYDFAQKALSDTLPAAAKGAALAVLRGFTEDRLRFQDQTAALDITAPKWQDIAAKLQNAEKEQARLHALSIEPAARAAQNAPAYKAG